MLAPDNANCPINSTKSMLTLNIFRHKNPSIRHYGDVPLCVFTSHLFDICHKHLQYFVILHGKFDIDELLMCTCMNTVYTPEMTATYENM